MKHRTSLIINAALWVVVVTLAFIMQVIPLLLILTMFNMAVGISSTTTLIAVPVALIGSLLIACAFAERRRRKWRPAPVRVDEDRHRQMAMMQNGGPKSRVPVNLLELRRRWFH